MAGFAKSTKLSDIKAGCPVKRYWLLPDSIKKLNENVPVSALITNLTNEWDVPLLVNGKVICILSVVKNKASEQKWAIAGGYEGSGPRLAYKWQKVITNWPCSSGYHPVLVEIENNHFFHVPEQNDSNLTYLNIFHHDNDSLEMLGDSTYSFLTSSRLLLRYLKVPHVSHFLTKTQVNEIKKENEKMRLENEQK